MVGEKMHIKFQPEKKINLPIRFVRVNNKILKHLLRRFFFFTIYDRCATNIGLQRK